MIKSDESASQGLRSRVSNNVRWSFIAELLGYSLLYVTVIVQTRRLGPDSFGVFSTATAIVLYAWLFSDAGTAFFGTREVAAGERDRAELYSRIVGARLTLGAAAATVSSIAAWRFGIPIWLWFAAVLYLLTYAFYAPWALKGVERFKALAIGTFTSSISLFIGTLLLVHDSSDSAVAAFIWSVSYGLGAVALIPALRQSGFRLARSTKLRLGELLRKTFPFAVTGVSLTTYHFAPLLILQIFADDTEVGIFSSPFRLILSAGTASFVIQSAVFPVLTALHENRKDFRRVVKMVGLALLPIGVGPAVVCWYFADELVEMALGNEFAASGQILRILAPLLLLFAVRNTARVSLLAMGRERLLQRCILIAPIVSITAAMLLIPSLSASGAAWALVAAELPLTIATVMAAFWSDRALRLPDASVDHTSEGPSMKASQS